MKKVSRTVNSVGKIEYGITNNDKAKICLCVNGAFLRD